MAVFVEPAPSGEAAEALAVQLKPVQRSFPGARIRVVPPGEKPGCSTDEWCVVVEAAADVEDLKQYCVDLLGE